MEIISLPCLVILLPIAGSIVWHSPGIYSNIVCYKKVNTNSNRKKKENTVCVHTVEKSKVQKILANPNTSPP